MPGLEEKDIKKLLGLALYLRARDTLRRGKVLEIEAGAGAVRALVKSSGDRCFEVEIRFDFHRTLDRADCSCSHSGYCEHIGAVLLKYLQEQAPYVPREILLLEGDYSLDLHDRGRFNHPLILNLKYQDISAGGQRAGRPKKRCRLIFTIEYDSRGRYPGIAASWLIGPALINIKQEGSRGKSQAFDDSKLTEPVTAKERELLGVLVSREPRREPLDHYLEFLLSEPRIELFLKNKTGLKRLQYAEIDRAVVRFQFAGLRGTPRESGPATPRESGPAEPGKSGPAAPPGSSQRSGREVREDAGSAPGSVPAKGSHGEPLFHPVLDFYEGSILLSSLEAPTPASSGKLIFYLVDQQKGVLLYRRGDTPCQLIVSDLLSGTLPFNFSEIKFLDAYAAKNFKPSLQVEFAARQVHVIHRRPVPIIDLDEKTGGVILELLFRYEGRVFPYLREETLLRLEDQGEELRVVERHLALEQDRYSFLRFLLSERIIREAAHFSSQSAMTFSLSGDLDSFLLEYGEKLLEEGFELRRKGRKIRRISGFSFQVSRHMDWLDLQARLVGDKGQVYPLRIDPDLLEGSFLRSDEGYYLLRKEDILRLKQLKLLGMDEQGLLRVSQYHFSLIDELYASIVNHEDRDLSRMKEIAAGLNSFAGIKRARLSRKFNGVLRQYQRAGLNWLHFLHSYRVNGCLADDMGLGKTVQTLALLQNLKDSGKLDQALIVAPLSTLANWEEETKRFTPNLVVRVHHGPQRWKGKHTLKKADMILTSYHTLRNDVEQFRQFSLSYLILDEAQTIKNPSSQIFKSVRLLDAEHRLSLTGTPVENNLIDLWSQMSFLNPGLLGSLEQFRRRFARPIEEGDGTLELELLRKTVFPFILRRKKEEVLDDLPPKEEILLYADMGPEQQLVYDEIKQHYRYKVTQSVEEQGLGGSAVVIFQALLKLRQAALFPGMAARRYRRVPSCKFDLLQGVLEEILAEGHKVLIFSQFLKSLSIIRDWVEGLGVGFCYLDGSTRNRAGQIRRFQEDADRRVFLISLKAGGLGINLTAADYVILFDPWWNPAVETQAVDRSHRIGQHSKVFIYKMIVRNTVEEKILKLQEKKKKLVEGIITSEKSFFKSLKKTDILKLFE